MWRTSHLTHKLATEWESHQPLLVFLRDVPFSDGRLSWNPYAERPQSVGNVWKGQRELATVMCAIALTALRVVTVFLEISVVTKPY